MPVSRLFISHSSANNDKAVEVRDWLAKNGWDDVFLDLDPERGIVAGQRWKEALQKAAYRCEVVLALVSKEWLASGWCKSEVDAARLIGKKVIAALVGVDKSTVPPDLTDEQFIDLTGDPQAYRRLKEGLKRAGLDPTTFPFEASRRPYPGFAYLEEDDAAVFFGRDAQIVRGLDEVRRLARAGVTRMLVILGASGSGKSSFLRAGLWSRLKRDDLAWLPLPIVRPERAAMSGKYGLSESLFEIISEPRFAQGIRQRGLPRSRVDIQDFVEKTDDGLAKLLAALRDIAQAGLSGESAPPPTTLLAIDQSEELFNEEGRDEAKRFIDILTKTLAADPRTIAILVMRSDAFPLVQSAPTLAALPKDTFTLDMMLEGSFRAVIEGPARLVEPPLAIDPQLTDALLEDISGQDALPLLAFTLAHLYDNTRVDNALTLSGYDKIGRVKGVIDKTVTQAFGEAAARGEAPKTKEEQYKLARSAFIPHLAQVNPAGQFVRRVAPREKIPDDGRPLIDRFAEQRLLIRDRRQDAEVIEVAHEALLRQPPFSDWLAEDREFLLWRDRLTQARAAFEADERGLLAGRELAIARSYMQTRAEREFEPADLAFIRESIATDDKRRAEEAEAQVKREAAEKEEQERRIRDAERIAEEQTKAAAAQRRFTRAAMVGLIIALGFAAVAYSEWSRAQESERQARAAEKTASTNEAKALAALSGIAISRGDYSDAVKLALAAWPRSTGDPRPQLPETIDALGRALTETPEVAAPLQHGIYNDVLSAAFNPDGSRILTVSSDEIVRVWDATTGMVIHELGERYKGFADATFSSDGKLIVTISKSDAQVWNAATGQRIGLMQHRKKINSASFSPNSALVLTASDDATAQVWNAANGEPTGKPLQHRESIFSAAFSPDGMLIVTGSFDHTAQVWNVATREPIGSPMEHKEAVLGATFSPDGKWVVTRANDATARVWDAAKGTPISKPLEHQKFVRSATFSPDSALVLTASDDTTARLWVAATGEPAGEPIQHGGEVNSAAFSPDGGRIVTAWNASAQLWNAATGAPIGKPIRHHGGVNAAAFSFDGARVVTASSDSTARVWETVGSPIGPPLRHPGSVTGASFSLDGARLATTSGNATQVWDAATGAPIGKVLEHDAELIGAALSAEGARVVTASNDKIVRVWDATSGAATFHPTQYKDAVLSVAFNADGVRVMTASGSAAQLWDAATGAQIGKPLEHGTNVDKAEFSADGGLVLTTSGTATRAGLRSVTRIWVAATGVPTSEPLSHFGEAQSVALSTDGARLLTNDGKTAQVWNAATRAAMAAIGKNLPPSTGATLSRDGAQVVTAEDNVAQVWDAATGEPIGPPFQTADKITRVAFSPDGRRVLTVSGNIAQLWTAPPVAPNIIATACKMLRNYDPSGLAERYGIEIKDPICTPSAPVPEPKLMTNSPKG
jgi:WD40 repeat protein